jgi:hypothetical protein
MEDNIDNYFLPLNSTRKVLIAVFFLDGECESEINQMVRAVIGGLVHSGFYTDAQKFGFTYNESTVNIYKEVPIFDVWGHLHSC